MAQCDERWIIRRTSQDSAAAELNELADINGDIPMKEEEEEEEAETGTDLQVSSTEMSSGLQRRWITEEDLTTPQQVYADPATAKEQTDGCTTGLSTNVDDSLSNVHSESTDSGIQSVGDGTAEEADKRRSRKPFSLIHQIFGGKMTTTYKCLNCCTESNHQDFFTDLHLAFPEKDLPLTETSPAPLHSQNGSEQFSLESLLNYYLAPEKLEGDNRYHCDNCSQLEEAERTLKLTQAPKHLLLTLLRFRYDKILQRRGKITTEVIYPKQLVLSVNDKPEVYMLYAVVIHSGLTLDGGHYYTIARSSVPPATATEPTTGKQDSWLMFNDAIVSFSDLNSLMDLSKKYSNDTPYMLFYCRIADVAASSPISSSAPLHLRQDLKDLVDRDNLKFMQEREQDLRRQLYNVPRREDRNDEDREEDHFQDNNISRFIY